MGIFEIIGPILNAQKSEVSLPNFHFNLEFLTENFFQANLVKLKNQIKILLNFFLSSKDNAEKISFDSEVNALSNILPLECSSLVKSIMLPHQLAVDLKTKKAISREDLDIFL